VQRLLRGGFYRERHAGRGFSAELLWLDRRRGTVAESDAELEIGWAYRPAEGRWVLLERASLGRRGAPNAAAASERLINNFTANLRIDARQELGLQYAFKRVRHETDAFGARAWLDLTGVEWRRRLRPKLDAGVHASWYRARDAGVLERGWGVDFGVVLAGNLLLVAGYNFSGFHDEDFAAARYTAAGPFVSFRMKIDQASLQDLLRR
jgi:hypothetical protein